MTTPALLRDERGAVVSAWTAVIATTMVLVLGIAVDLWRHRHPRLVA